MYSRILNYLLPITSLRKRLRFSESNLSKQADISRSTLRHIEAHEANIRLESIASVAHALNLELDLVASPSECKSELSTVGVSFHVIQDGPSSWKIHFFNLVDQFRQTLNPKLVLLPPPEALPFNLRALLASIVWTLCDEARIDAPHWAQKRYFLEIPWFVSETDSLKASALIESPICFRHNNIFVLSNFLERA